RAHTLLIYLFLFLHTLISYRDLHSFPTRRSSDLWWQPDLSLRQKSWKICISPCCCRAVLMSLPAADDVSNNCWPARRTKRRPPPDRKSTRLNSSHDHTSYAVFCLKKKNEMRRSGP